MRCPICNREAGENRYCNLHAKAYENIIAKYDRWKKALDTSWKEYLSEIAENSFTGEWVREAAKYLLITEDKPNVKNS